MKEFHYRGGTVTVLDARDVRISSEERWQDVDVHVEEIPALVQALQDSYNHIQQHKEG